MIQVGTRVEARDNAGGILFTCLHVDKGPRRRYGRLGEMIRMSSYTRKRYSQSRDRLNELLKDRAARISKRVKKKRKIKAKKKRRPNMRPYLGLLVALKSKTRRPGGINIEFDDNYVFTFTEPTKFGPAGKTEGIPNFVGTQLKAPIVVECVRDFKTRRMYATLLKEKVNGIV
jgi:ribosomal protein L14